MRLTALALLTALGMAIATTVAAAQPPDTAETGPQVRLDLMAGGLTAPTYLVEQGGSLYVADQPGQIHVLTTNGQLREEPFLDLSDRIVDLQEDFDERGLLGIAFHPNYAQNQRFFVYYSAPLDEDAPDEWDHTSHLSEFTAREDGESADPDSERVLLRVDQPQFNHNAGHIKFGPDDGYLYVPLGDGGGSNDADMGHPPGGHGQATDTLLGSILRLDVDGEGNGERPYGIPADNPFVDEGEVRDEIYAYGLRNPFALVFDNETGELYAADAGQDLYEAVYRIEAGENYGWPIREGSQCFDQEAPTEPPEQCPETGERGEPLAHPVIEYERGPETGSVLVGAVPYRGDRVSALQGNVVFADWTSDVPDIAEPSGRVFVAEVGDPVDPDGPWPTLREVLIANPPAGAGNQEVGRFILSVRQDDAGEVYLLTTQERGPTGESGQVWRLAAVGDTDTTPGADVEDTAWIWIVIAVVALLVVIGAVMLTRRRSVQ